MKEKLLILLLALQVEARSLYDNLADSAAYLEISKVPYSKEFKEKKRLENREIEINKRIDFVTTGCWKRNQASKWWYCPKYHFGRYDLTEEDAHVSMWYLLYTMQVLDVYSTYKGMKYDCVFEANPLLPRVPKIPEMLALKTFVFYPVYRIDQQNIVPNRSLIPASLISTAVVLSNVNTYYKVKDVCGKR